jgi:hypothetical protein
MLLFKLPTKKAFFSKKTKFKPKIMFFFFGRAASPPARRAYALVLGRLASGYPLHHPRHSAPSVRSFCGWFRYYPSRCVMYKPYP